MKLRTRLVLVAASALMVGAASSPALAQRGGPPRDPHMNRPGPPRRGPPPRPYYHDYNSRYYQAPVYAPPPYVYAPPPSPGISLVIPFHF